MKKTINRFKLLKDYFFKKSQVSGLPLELVIEVTNKCNLSCIMCTRKNMTRPIGLMNFKLYRKITDEASAYLELVYLYGEGEPLFHPRIFEMIRYAKSRGLSVGLSTNATLLTKEKSYKLIQSGLDYLIIALDAVNGKTYQKVRGGKNFNQVVRNVKDYLRLKKRSTLSPFTVLQFVKLAENEREAPAFRKFWANKGADVVRIKPVIDLLRQNPSAALRAGKLPRRPCFYLWRQLNMIAWNGKFVTPCCMDAEGDYSLGDANTHSLKGIWNGKPMIALRRAHLNGGWKKVSLCRDCTYPQPSFPGKLGAMIFSDMMVKKILPYLERISFSRFHVYD